MLLEYLRCSSPAIAPSPLALSPRAPGRPWPPLAAPGYLHPTKEHDAHTLATTSTYHLGALVFHKPERDGAKQLLGDF